MNRLYPLYGDCRTSDLSCFICCVKMNLVILKLIRLQIPFEDAIARKHDFFFFFFFQAEDGIRDLTVTGVQTCALPICGVGDISALATQAKIDTIKLPKIFLYPITVSPRMG